MPGVQIRRERISNRRSLKWRPPTGSLVSMLIKQPLRRRDWTAEHSSGPAITLLGSLHDPVRPGHAGEPQAVRYLIGNRPGCGTTG